MICDAFLDNFNHERWAGVNGCIRLSRVCLEQAIEHVNATANSHHASSAHKLAEMASMVEGAQAMQDNLTYQIYTGKDIFGPELGGYSALW